MNKLVKTILRFCILKIVEISAVVAVYLLMVFAGSWVMTTRDIWIDHSWFEQWIIAPGITFLTFPIIAGIFGIGYGIVELVKWNWKIAKIE